MLTIFSAGVIVHSMLLTKFVVTERYQVNTGNFKENINIQHQHGRHWKMAAAQQWCWKMTAVRWHFLLPGFLDSVATTKGGDISFRWGVLLVWLMGLLGSACRYKRIHLLHHGIHV
jgi:hypothetical protein